MKALYTISEVARYFGVTNQTLHYYDKIGLLKPSNVNAETKYRYYNQQQFNKMFMIRELKRIGFSLEEILAYEKNKNLNSLGAVLLKNREEITRQIEELNRVGARIDFYLDMIKLAAQAHSKFECQFLHLPVRQIFYINANFELDDLSQYVEILYKAYVKVARLCLPKETDHKMILTMEKNQLDKGQFRYYSGIGLLVPWELKHPNSYTLSGQLCAVAHHVGDYKTLPATYKKMLAYISQSAYEVCGNATEVSLTNIVHTELEQEFVTEIQIPVKRTTTA